MSASLVEALATDRGSARCWSADSNKNYVSLHVYVVPSEKWQEERKLASSVVTEESSSLGFIRVSPEASVRRLRQEIAMQLGPQIVSDDFAFLKSVGRNFTQVKLHQEEQLRARNFAPPFASEPEIYLIKIKSESRLETTASFFSDDKAHAIKGLKDDLLALNSSPHTDMNTMTFPALTFTPEQGLQTVLPASAVYAGAIEGQTEDSGVMSEDDSPSPDSSPAIKAITLPNNQGNLDKDDSFDAEKEQEDFDDTKSNKDGSVFGESAPAIVEAIPSLSEHRLFQEQDDDPSPGPILSANLMDKPQEEDQPSKFAPRIQQNGDYSVTFVILEDEDDVLSKSATPSVIQDEPDGELEEAEEPQQFRLFQGSNKSNNNNNGQYKNREDEENEDELALMRELREISILNREEEARRHLLVGRATDLQHKLRGKKEKKQAALRTQLVAARKAQVPLEHACHQLRLELDRQLMSALDNGKEQQVRVTGHREGPSRRADLKMAACRLQREVKDLNRNIGAVKLRLESEIKMRTQVEIEIRNFRTELAEKKAAVSSLRSSRLMPAKTRANAIVANKA
ncbi:uncharacterized protein LOC135946033 [Cloeon dipterum]|uniref:uncharacterized protein LOC135946033 n=1 Tax=Cloeon dipterum TaxID=197152 RepID=UPI0032205355